MNCPVCDRVLAPTLSICPSCGAMMNDTVREELQTKVTCRVSDKTFAEPDAPRPHAEPAAQPQIVAAPPALRAQTAELTVAKTSPTLIEFQNKSNVIPEWRLEIQNAVQKRIGASAAAVATAPAKGDLQLSGATGLKARPARKADPVVAHEISDPRVASALKRINESRKTYLPPAKAWKKPTMLSPAKPYRLVPNHVKQPPPPKPVSVAAPPAAVDPRASAALPVTVAAPKRITNRLPKLESVFEKPEDAKIETATSDAVVREIPKLKSLRSGLNEVGKSEARTPEFSDVNRIRIKAEAIEIEAVEKEEPSDDIEDLAPISMRFGACLFDMIIGGFVTLVLLSPFAFAGGNWWTKGGLLTFAVVWFGVLFMYMTVSLGFYGKTMGMRLFSLELVDAIENEYPTMRQAAINTGMFLITLPFGGAGFLTVLINEENRALHDLFSGTILVREF